MNLLASVYHHFEDWLKSCRPYSLSILIVVVWTCVYFVGSEVVKSRVSEKLDCLVESEARMAQSLRRLESAYEARHHRPTGVFTELFQQISGRKTYYHDMVVLTLSTYIMAILLLILSTVAGGILLSQIVVKGWSAVTVRVQAFFYAIFFEAVFGGIFINAFSLSDNLTFNTDQYVAHDQIQLAVYEHVANRSLQVTGRLLPIQTDSTVMARDTAVLRAAHTALRRVNQLRLTIDQSKLQSLSDVSKILGKQ